MIEKQIRETPGSGKNMDPGENMNIRRVHAAIWREEVEPSEAFRRTPSILKHFYFIMLLWLVFYFGTLFPPLKWDEYEASALQRALRDRSKPENASQTP
jgi:hypothetical protein